MEANPFNSPEFKKAILEKEGKLENHSEDYEIIDTEETNDLKAMISGAPTIPGKVAKNMILDASLISKNEKEKKAQEMEIALNQIMTKYNEEYGLDLSIDLHSLSNTLALVSSDPKMTRVLELYSSRIYRSVKAILSLHLIQRLSILVEHITSPEYLLGSQELTLADKFLVIEKLISYIDTLGELKDTMEIKGDDIELKKLAEENTDLDFESPESKEAINNFMNLFNKEYNKDDSTKK